MDTIEITLLEARNLKAAKSGKEFCIAVVSIDNVLGEIFLNQHARKGETLTVKPVWKRDDKMRLTIAFEIV